MSLIRVFFVSLLFCGVSFASDASTSLEDAFVPEELAFLRRLADYRARGDRTDSLRSYEAIFTSKTICKAAFNLGSSERFTRVKLRDLSAHAPTGTGIQEEKTIGLLLHIARMKEGKSSEGITEGMPDEYAGVLSAIFTQYICASCTVDMFKVASGIETESSRLIHFAMTFSMQLQDKNAEGFCQTYRRIFLKFCAESVWAKQAYRNIMSQILNITGVEPSHRVVLGLPSNSSSAKFKTFKKAILLSEVTDETLRSMAEEELIEYMATAYRQACYDGYTFRVLSNLRDEVSNYHWDRKSKVYVHNGAILKVMKRPKKEALATQATNEINQLSVDDQIAFIMGTNGKQTTAKESTTGKKGKKRKDVKHISTQPKGLSTPSEINSSVTATLGDNATSDSKARLTINDLPLSGIQVMGSITGAVTPNDTDGWIVVGEKPKKAEPVAQVQIATMHTSASKVRTEPQMPAAYVIDLQDSRAFPALEELAAIKKVEQEATAKKAEEARLVKARRAERKEAKRALKKVQAAVAENSAQEVDSIENHSVKQVSVLEDTDLRTEAGQSSAPSSTSAVILPQGISLPEIPGLVFGSFGQVDAVDAAASVVTETTAPVVLSPASVPGYRKFEPEEYFGNMGRFISDMEAAPEHNRKRLTIHMALKLAETGRGEELEKLKKWALTQDITAIQHY